MRQVLPLLLLLMRWEASLLTTPLYFQSKRYLFLFPSSFFLHVFSFSTSRASSQTVRKEVHVRISGNSVWWFGEERNSLNEPSPSAWALQRRTLFRHYYVLCEMWLNSSRLSSVTRRWYNKCGRLSSLSRVKRWLSRHWIISVSN